MRHARRRSAQEGADRGGYFGAKNGQASKAVVRAFAAHRAAWRSRSTEALVDWRGASAGRPSNKKPVN